MGRVWIFKCAAGAATCTKTQSLLQISVSVLRKWLERMEEGGGQELTWSGACAWALPSSYGCAE